jgi:hypothetical protein
MILYTCGQKKAGPGFAHPCAKGRQGARRGRVRVRAEDGRRLPADALDLGQSRRGAGRVKKLSGTNEVPILVLDDGEVISGSSTIARWAKEHPSSPAKGAS